MSVKHDVRQHHILAVQVQQDPCRGDGLHNVNVTHALAQTHT